MVQQVKKNKRKKEKHNQQMKHQNTVKATYENWMILGGNAPAHGYSSVHSVG